MIMKVVFPERGFFTVLYADPCDFLRASQQESGKETNHEDMRMKLGLD